MGVDMLKTTSIVPFLWKKWNEKLVNNSIITQFFYKVIHVPFSTVFPFKIVINVHSRPFDVSVT